MTVLQEATPSISIHALHEESDRILFPRLRLLAGISIHALHEESDCFAQWPRQ